MRVINPFMRSLLAAATIGLAACAGTGVGPGPSSTVAVEVSAPESVAGFTREFVKPDPDRFVGTQLRYRSQRWPELLLDVFVHVIGFTADGDLPVQDFAAGFDLYMAESERLGIYRSIELLERGFLDAELAAGIPKRGFRAVFEAESGEQAIISLTHFFYRAPFALKFRSSHPAHAPPQFVAEEADRFARTLLPELSMVDRIACPDGARLVLPATPATSADARRADLIEAFMAAARAGCLDYDRLAAAHASGTDAGETPP
jgi:hypothetical protein